jgi:hypothetical protein
MALWPCWSLPHWLSKRSTWMVGLWDRHHRSCMSDW